MVKKLEPICYMHLCHTTISHQQSELKHSFKTFTERMLSSHGLSGRAVKLKRPVGLILACSLPREAAVEAAFVDFVKPSHFTLTNITIRCAKWKGLSKNPTKFSK